MSQTLHYKCDKHNQWYLAQTNPKSRDCSHQLYDGRQCFFTGLTLKNQKLQRRIHSKKTVTKNDFYFLFIKLYTFFNNVFSSSASDNIAK